MVLGSACSVNLSGRGFILNHKTNLHLYSRYEIKHKPVSGHLGNFFSVWAGAWENNMQLYLRISECFFTHQMSVSVLKVVDNMNHLKQ